MSDYHAVEELIDENAALRARVAALDETYRSNMQAMEAINAELRARVADVEELARNRHTDLLECEAQLENAATDSIVALNMPRRTVEQESYPTVWAYEQACKALENTKQQLATATEHCGTWALKHQTELQRANLLQQQLATVTQHLADQNERVVNLSHQLSNLEAKRDRLRTALKDAIQCADEFGAMLDRDVRSSVVEPLRVKLDAARTALETP